ncbi:MAG: hypothetical protein V5A43_05495 [Haloarculaceae archaeon]
MTREPRDVGVVRGGVAGLTATTFTARAGLDTIVCDTGESILRRTAHLENFPGFLHGVNSRALLDVLQGQAEWNGVDRRAAEVTRLEPTDRDRLAVTTVDPGAGKAVGVEARAADEPVDSTRRADFVIATSWAATDHLAAVSASA